MKDINYKKMHIEFKQLLKKIISYQNIIIYRHQSPDYDALGSQMGLYCWIKDNFPSKEVHFFGDNSKNLQPLLYPESEIIDDSFFLKEHLAITVDVADSLRVAQEKISLAKEIIKIDHHPLPVEEKRFGDFVICYPDIPACAEIISLFILSREKKYVISKEVASYLYSGIVGDTGRFLYHDTESHTLRVAASLLDVGFDKDDLYDRMYLTDERRLKILSYVLSSYKLSDGGVAYFVFDKKTMSQLNMTIDEGNMFINNLRNLDRAKAVISVTEDIKKGDFRVSIRSLKKPISAIATKYNGGGHDFAAGCRLSSLDDLPQLIKDLEEIVK